MDLRDELQRIYDRHNELTPAMVVDEARNENHPLHNRFEWDDRVAGEAWRRHQAHEMIRSVRIVYRDQDGGTDKSVRAFHAVRSEKGHVYEPTDEVVRDPFLSKMVLADMEREWNQLRRRYEQFQEFYDMVRRDLDQGAA